MQVNHFIIFIIYNISRENAFWKLILTNRVPVVDHSYYLKFKRESKIYYNN